MDDTHLRHHEVHRATRVKAILEDGLLDEAFSTLEAQCLTAWRNAPARDTEGREGIWHTLKALDGVRGYLLEILQTGQMAEEQLRTLRSEPLS